ncbi:phosphatidylinositol-specific phospholipase C domain-containing protein [Granulibacter bethesdensis]|uniref:General secretion pathway protein N n=1 Tax=Granulibacter bethesdensis (strain ATCC BAA-1260 / CGDNIH1) TaxID=391165 RepID=Q0BR90_GRABC|nr:phosphatidylinositol-specific phospholipase C domain-containing protein [Granulibacter bethesdensis]ABI62662.1 General secretion pathway protein N [Granulibacter bethesdensis CGDNIH1]AHJ68393.1 General secretion pathway protein N [Granulibacter bethesdensis]APH52519.1 General secretion pathway protein N [Granulibacter bethesdensis]APH65208.1 General secretion pathway protein N [Granulibacter bethesdensis]
MHNDPRIPTSITKRNLLKGIAGGTAASVAGLAIAEEADAWSFTSWLRSIFYPTYTVNAQITTFLDSALSAAFRTIGVNAGTQNYTVQNPGVFDSRTAQLSVTGLTAAFQTKSVNWFAQIAGNQIKRSNTEIAPFGDRLSSTDLGSMLASQRSITGGNFSLSYGFYNAAISDTILNAFDGGVSPPACSDLSHAYQFYMYLTDRYNTWMGDLVNATPRLASQPFGVFVLPGAHDAGMNGMPRLGDLFANNRRLDALLNSLLNNISPVGRQLLSLGGTGFLRALPQSTLSRVIRNLAVTQKDDTATMLNLGIRYFDFRPGYIFPAGASEQALGLFHQHNMIPGGSYTTFLADVLNWLKANPSEIVVLHINSQGLYNDAMIPSQGTLDSALSSALSQYGAGIKSGDKTAFGSSYASLISANKRLIVLYQSGSYRTVTRYDSYSDGAYGTTCPASILGALNNMNAGGQSSADYTVLQLQGTATNTKSGAAAAILGDGDASSPLLATKPVFDAATIPWVRGVAGGRFLPRQPLVLLNDFADNAMTSTAIAVTRQRSSSVA